VNVLKCTADIISGALADIFNENMNRNAYPSSLKIQNITPLYKGEERTAKKNYRGVKSQNSWKNFYLTTYLATGLGTELNIA
jgi:hypothetical protein